MKKIVLFFVALTILTTGCGNIVARKDKSQIVQFENKKIVASNYNILFYKLLYPENPNDKDEFYKELNVLTSKMMAYHKDINIIIPLELYKDLKNLQIRDVRESEKIFYKQSYSLTDEEKELIDSKIDVNTPTDSGSIQSYLNKQIAYWYDYLNRGEQYDANRHYAELDKDRIVNEVFENRKFFSNIVFALKDDLVLEVKADELKEVKDFGVPLYLKVNELPSSLDNLKSKIFIIEGNVSDTVIPEKILLIDNKTVENVKDYEITTKIEDITNPLTLIPRIDEYQDLKIKDILNFKVKYVPNSTLKKASVKEKERERKTINFRSNDIEWEFKK